MTNGTDNNDQAPVAPLPGGDLKIYVWGLVGTSAVNGLIMLAVTLLRPNQDNSAFFAAVAVAFAPTYGVLVGYLRSHANANQLREVQRSADAAAIRAETAVRVAADTREALDANTDLTARTKEAVEKVAGTLPPSLPKR